MAPRASWKGYLKLSLVTCAVNLYPASSTSSRVSFTTINRKTGHKVKRQFVDAETGEVVEGEDQGKGYPVGKDSYLLIEDDELDRLQLESSHTIEIDKFVPRSEIDDRYLETPYYIAPGERVAEEAFAIIRDAMRDENVVGLGRVVISRRERIMLLEPFGKGLLGTALRYGSEVRGEKPYFEDIAEISAPKELTELAHVIIERKAGHFDPQEFTDRYEDALVALVRAKEAGAPLKAADQRPPSNVVNLMEALKKSIAASGGAEAAPRREAAKPVEDAQPAPKPKAPSKAKGGTKPGAANASTGQAAPRAKRAKAES